MIHNKGNSLLRLAALVALLMAALSPAPVAHAATIAVNSTADVIANDGQCTLREAITAANTDTASGAAAGECPAGNGTDTITLPAGTYTLSIGGTGEDGNATGDLDITDDLTINGAGEATTIIDADQIDRVLHIVGDVTVVINDVTITNGKTPDGTGGGNGGDGGGIYNRGDLTITDSTVSGNRAGDGGDGGYGSFGGDGGYGGYGGGIYNSEGTVEITGSTVSSNRAGDGGDGGEGIYSDGYGGEGGYGGGIYNYAGTLTITDSTVSSNSTGDGGSGEDGYGGSGGGIGSRSGTVEIADSTLSGNSCGSGYSGGEGGGIYNSEGTLEITNSTLSGNSSGSGDADDEDGDGGGLYSASCSPVITNVTFSDNVSQDRGGGMRHIDSGNPTLTNVTFSGNTATNHGGGIYMWGSGTLTLINCTITDNTADSDNANGGDGGGIYRHSGTVNFKNTILAGNADPSSAPDCSGALTSQGYNLIQDTTGCTISGDTTGNITGQDPKLGPLANNGGPTETHALLTGSPAINAIPEGGTGYNGAPSTDQRGVSRPQGDNCDIGAYEKGNEFEFGDAPEGGVAYPSTGILGAFPTCKTSGPSGWIQHDNFGAWFGPTFGFELDGNAGGCPPPGCFPPYDQDECFNDGDAGLIVPEPYTIVGAAGSESVVTCPASAGTALGNPCQLAQWGNDIDILIHNWMPGHELYVSGYVNVLIDWNQDGQWQNDPTTTCSGNVVAEHVLVDFQVPAKYDGTLSALGPPSFQIGPNVGYVWVRFSITEQLVNTSDWDGEGTFEDGETEDYLLRVIFVEPPPPPPEPVGGTVVPVNRLGLVLPWLGLAALTVAVGGTLLLGIRKGKP